MLSQISRTDVTSREGLTPILSVPVPDNPYLRESHDNPFLRALGYSPNGSFPTGPQLRRTGKNNGRAFQIAVLTLLVGLVTALATLGALFLAAFINVDPLFNAGEVFFRGVAEGFHYMHVRLAENEHGVHDPPQPDTPKTIPEKTVTKPPARPSPKPHRLQPIQAARESVMFVAVEGDENLRLWKEENLDLVDGFQNLWDHRFVFGSIIDAGPTYFVPSSRPGKEAEFRMLASSHFAGLKFVEVYPPALWEAAHVDQHKNQWSRYVYGVTVEAVDQWSTTQSWTSNQSSNKCAPGGVCLLLATRWEPDAFSDFRIWAGPLDQTTR
jgi:hypothetical protein